MAHRSLCMVATLLSMVLLSATTAFAQAPALRNQTAQTPPPALQGEEDTVPSNSQAWHIITPTGQYGGKVTCVAVSAQGTLAYVGLGQRLAVLDISNPTLPTTVGETPLLLNQPFDLAMQGNYVYVTMYAAFQQSGLAIVDVSNPSSPVVAGVTSALNSPQGLAVAGAYAYVVDVNAGLHIVDVSQPAQPRVVGTLDTPGYARDVAVADNYAYVADYNALRVIDISNPLRPREVGSLTTVSASRVAVSGTTVYVTEWYGDGLRIVDVANPAAPREISTALTDTAPWDVTIDGSYAYAADNSGLHILDVSNPAGPIRMGYYSIPRVDGPAPIALRVAAANAKAFLVGRDGSIQILNVAGLRTIGEIGRVGTNTRTGGVALVDSLAYVAAAETGLQIIDVLNPSNPIEIGHIDTPGRAWDVAIAGHYAYVADGRTDSGHSSGLRIIDVSSPQHPVEVGSIVTPGEPLGVTFFNHLAYVADGEEGGLRIIDVATPSHPQELGFLDTPGQANDVAVVARGAAIYAYLADVIAGVRVINVTDPAHPIDVGHVPQAPGGEWNSVAVRGDYVFASDSYWEWAGLYVIDVRNPVAPRIVAYAPVRKASDVTLVGNFAYVGGADYFPSPTIPPGGMFKFDISNAAQPRLVGAFDLPAPVTGIASDGTLAYLAVYGPGLVVADASGATTAVESRVIESATIADVAVASNSAYVTGDRGLGVLDVSNPANPVMRGRYNTVGRTLSVVVAGNIAYVTESEHLDRNLNAYVGGGLHIVDIQDPQLPVGLGFYEKSRLGDGLATQGRYRIHRKSRCPRDHRLS